MSGKVEGAAERVFSQGQALRDGVCVLDRPAAEAAERTMIELGLNSKDYEGSSVGEIAERIVRDVLSGRDSKVV